MAPACLLGIRRRFESRRKGPPMGSLAIHHFPLANQSIDHQYWPTHPLWRMGCATTWAQSMCRYVRVGGIWCTQRAHSHCTPSIHPYIHPIQGIHQGNEGKNIRTESENCTCERSGSHLIVVSASQKETHRERERTASKVYTWSQASTGSRASSRLLSSLSS